MKINKEYKEMTNDILNNDIFLILKNDHHHGTNKYDHCKRVAYISFLMSKIFKGDTLEVTRAGLLHDFFFGERTASIENSYTNHPKTSMENAKKYFNIDNEEANIIETHMYHYALIKRLTPFMKDDEKEYLKTKRPKDKNGVIVCISDLLVSIFECFTYKARYSMGLYAIFIINLINLN